MMHDSVPTLIKAGAVTVKTRTLDYRLARLVESVVDPSQILLLTFTRRAASEMLRRASQILDERCQRVEGGHFIITAANCSGSMQLPLVFPNSLPFWMLLMPWMPSIKSVPVSIFKKMPAAFQKNRHCTPS